MGPGVGATLSVTSGAVASDFHGGGGREEKSTKDFKSGQ